MVFQNTTLLKSMEQASKIKIKKIAADGGATQSDLLMQLQTDSAKVPVLRPKMVYITARGAAKAALKGFGRLTPSLANKERKKFTPSQASPQVVKQYSRWYRSAEFIDRFYR
jgi:glycerol kinase